MISITSYEHSTETSLYSKENLQVGLILGLTLTYIVEHGIKELTRGLIFARHLPKKMTFKAMIW